MSITILLLRRFCLPSLKCVCSGYFMNRGKKAVVIERDSIEGTRHPPCSHNYWSRNCVEGIEYSDN